MFLQGYGPALLAGTWQTIQLSLLSLLVSFVLGLIGAGAKLSRNRIVSGIATGYTTLIRGVPDLVLMLLLFFSMQIWLNDLTDWLNVDDININPFVAGVLTWALSTALISPKPSAVRSWPCHAARSKQAPHSVCRGRKSSGAFCSRK